MSNLKIYTKTGDTGQTSLHGGQRVGKNHPRVNTYGTIDELNTVIGIAIQWVTNGTIKQDLEWIQSTLFSIGSDIATPPDQKRLREHISEVDCQKCTQRLETTIDAWDEKLPTLTNFILPGGSKGAAYLHQARTVCRRAERLLISLSEAEEVNPTIIQYLNRLSDFLFTIARAENYSQSIPDVIWKKPKDL